MGLFGFMPLVVVVLGAWPAWMVFTIVRALVMPRRLVKEPCCERCRYPVAGLAGVRCPECGTDLRRTGIITAPLDFRLRGGTFRSVLALWLLWCAALSFAAATVLNDIIQDSLRWDIAVRIGAVWILAGLGATWLIARRRRTMRRRIEGRIPSRSA